jgi:type IV pilus assembly protein PilE
MREPSPKHPRIRAGAGARLGRRIAGRGPAPARPRGFTLIELLIVVAIVGIIAAIAYPSYLDQVRRARRADAQAVLTQNAQLMERFFTENGRYDQDVDGNAPEIVERSPRDPGYPAFYAIELRDLDRTVYRLLAVPQGPQVGTGNLDIDQTGLRHWDRDGDGSFEAGEDTWAH